jgi:outer membrane immunogenic protein
LSEPFLGSGHQKDIKMKNIMLNCVGAAAVMTAIPSAQAQSLEGFKIGASVGRQVDEVAQPLPGTAGQFDRNEDSISFRGFAGYDQVIADRLLLGAEIGVGYGGEKMKQTVGTSGVAQAKPGISVDASVRAGVLVTKGFAIYGRGGYAYTDLKRTFQASPTASKVSFGKSESGLQYGAGMEVAIIENFNLRGEFIRTDFDRNIRRDELRIGAALRF